MARVWNLVDYDAGGWYEEMRFETRCWACGAGCWDAPDDWHAPFLIERAHIVANPRREDRRAVVMLCSRCHRVQHGEQIVGCDLPKLELSHLLWIKRFADRAWFDLEFLAKNHIGALPTPERPPAIYRT